MNIVGNLVRVQLQLKNSVEFVLEAPETLPTNFITDEQRLKQILINLLRNSIKFTLRGTIKLSISEINYKEEEEEEEGLKDISDS